MQTNKQYEVTIQYRTQTVITVSAGDNQEAMEKAEREILEQNDCAETICFQISKGK